MDIVLAYIDAGTGGMLLQALAAGAAGLWLLVRTRLRPGKQEPESSETPAE
ncbi:MAG: hypothetical protein AB1Z57_11820 [Acidimicrobiia bacterium]